MIGLYLRLAPLDVRGDQRKLDLLVQIAFLPVYLVLVELAVSNLVGRDDTAFGQVGDRNVEGGDVLQAAVRGLPLQSHDLAFVEGNRRRRCDASLRTGHGMPSGSVVVLHILLVTVFDCGDPDERHAVRCGDDVAPSRFHSVNQRHSVSDVHSVLDLRLDTLGKADFHLEATHDTDADRPDYELDFGRRKHVLIGVDFDHVAAQLARLLHIFKGLLGRGLQELHAVSLQLPRSLVDVDIAAELRQQVGADAAHGLVHRADVLDVGVVARRGVHRVRVVHVRPGQSGVGHEEQVTRFVERLDDGAVQRFQQRAVTEGRDIDARREFLDPRDRLVNSGQRHDAEDHAKTRNGGFLRVFCIGK